MISISRTAGRDVAETSPCDQTAGSQYLAPGTCRNDVHVNRQIRRLIVRCRSFVSLCWVICILGTIGCHRDMRDQSHVETYDSSEFFQDGQSARPVITGTVARGTLQPDDALHTGKTEGRFAAELPVKATLELMQRGRQRFDIFCAPCHDYTGSGHGMIVQRGFSEPPSYHTERLRKAPAGHFFDVISNGFRNMPRYGPQISVHDRWAIIAYIRALQFSHNARTDDIPVDLRNTIDAGVLKEQP